MKTNIFIILSFIFFTSCKKEMMKNFDTDDWNHERAILDIAFENQVGAATIARDEEHNGTVTFMYNESKGDANLIKLKMLELSLGAKSDIQIEQTLTFNADHESEVKVISASGRERIWKIKYVPFKDDLVGTWQITTLSLYGGAWPEYGSSAVVDNIAERSWNWNSDNSGPIAEYDNTLTFTLEGITEEGDAYGKIINNAGVDGKFADFIFITDPDNSRTPIDVNDRYRKIPKNEGVWKRNSKQGTITFSSDNLLSVGKFVESGQYTMDTYGKVITIANYAFEFEHQPNFIWRDIYNDRERFVDNLKRFWIQVKKVTP